MFWQEDSPKTTKLTTQVTDLAFEIDCPALPLDHAYALATAIQTILPWFATEPFTGLHLIRGANSGNGWHSPEGEDVILHLSRRNKLTLRLPLQRVFEAQALRGNTLTLENYPMKIGKATQKPLTATPVVFARYVRALPSQTEDEFLEYSVNTLQLLGVECRKALCGKTHLFKHPAQEIFTRSLMIADLQPEESLILQQHGIGLGRNMGFGLFIPHKDIKSLDTNINMEFVGEV
jgi:CRISPR-associated protein Cas6